MQKDIIAKQPVLNKALEETEALKVIVTKETEEANVKKGEVAIEEEKCQADEKIVLGIKAECEEGLAKAIPALAAAEKAVKDLNKDDIKECSGFKMATPAVEANMQMVCLFFKHIKNQTNHLHVCFDSRCCHFKS
jgi:hypothetical protein